MFDAGLWTAIPKSDHILIHVAKPRFTESPPMAGSSPTSISASSTSTTTPDQARLRPDAAYLAWHRSRHRI